jgi:hypothetical protein
MAPWIEPTSAAIVLLWLSLALRRSSQPRRLLLAYVFVLVTAWASEETCIRLYGFYAYSPDWSVFVGHVPLMVAIIWPVVVLSAHSLVRAALRGGSPWLPLVGGAVVLSDAALIEPVCVHAGLWRWTHPGLFEVPPVGVLGWALYAGLAMIALERIHRGRPWGLAGALCIPGTHALLLLIWWGGLRWVEASIPTWPAVATAWLLGSAVALALLRWAPRLAVPRALALDRTPAAGFFLLLLVAAQAEPALYAWALASTPAWLAITRGGRPS